MQFIIIIIIMVITAVTFLLTYPFLKVASDSDRKMEEIMRNHNIKKTKPNNHPELPEH